MKTIGIVGSEGKKFTPASEQLARNAIRALIKDYDRVVSGACHLGGIDVWAIDEARKQGKLTEEFPPKTHKWEGGYKQRNLQIVEAADKVVCITLDKLPDSYHGMTFKLCYHCGTADHVKSGGCWTMKQAAKQGKGAELVVLNTNGI